LKKLLKPRLKKKKNLWTQTISCRYLKKYQLLRGL